MNYFKLALAKKNTHSIFVFDDIYWSEGMQRAWKEICANKEVTLSVDLFYFGIVFFKTENMLKRVLGVVLFLVGILLSISMLSFIFKMIFIKNTDTEGQDDVYIVGYYFGQFVTLLLFSFLIFLLLKYGYRMMKGKKQVNTIIQEIDSIGEN